MNLIFTLDYIGVSPFHHHFNPLKQRLFRVLGSFHCGIPSNQSEGSFQPTVLGAQDKTRNLTVGLFGEGVAERNFHGKKSPKTRK